MVVVVADWLAGWLLVVMVVVEVVGRRGPRASTSMVSRVQARAGDGHALRHHEISAVGAHAEG